MDAALAAIAHCRSELTGASVQKAKAGGSGGGDGELVFLRPEEEHLHAHASWSCMWRVPGAGEFRRQARAVRVLMLVPVEAAHVALQGVAAAFSHDLAQHRKMS
jgi:hypothetical protein